MVFHNLKPGDIMDRNDLQDGRMGFSNAQWVDAASKATAVGHQTGSHEWWDHIRDTLGIPRSCCQ